jgi:hypothetical protein
VAHLIQDLWYKVTHLSGGEEREVHGRYLGLARDPDSEDGADHHLFQVEGEGEPVRIHPDHVVDFFEMSPPMPFPR